MSGTSDRGCPLVERAAGHRVVELVAACGIVCTPSLLSSAEVRIVEGLSHELAVEATGRREEASKSLEEGFAFPRLFFPTFVGVEDLDLLVSVDSFDRL